MDRNRDKNFLLCLHDLNVKNFGDISLKIKKIADVAGCSFSLAVVPSTEEVEDNLKAEFKSVLKDLQTSGFELLLHGTEHKADLSLCRSAFGKIALKLTNNEAEFAGLLEKESLALLAKSLQFWNDLGFENSECFVPPAWYGNPFLKSQVLSRMKRYEARSYVFSKKASGVKSVFSPALSFAGIPRWVEKIAIAYARFVLSQPLGIPRLVFHPVDFEVLGEENILELVRNACSKRCIVKYASL